VRTREAYQLIIVLMFFVTLRGTLFATGDKVCPISVQFL